MNRQNNLIRLKSTMAGFEEAFCCLPSNQIMSVRQELMKKLGWSISIFYYKKRGDTPIWENEASVIESALSKFNIDARTGKPINNQ